MVQNPAMFSIAMLLASLLASSIAIPAAFTHAAQGKEKPAAALPAVSSPAASPAPTSAPPRSIPADVRSPRQAMMFIRLWGIDNIRAQETASGSMIRFSYRVVDETKAKTLNDERATPYLLDGTTGAKLEVPETEMMGKLRQIARPLNGREYWMVFLNGNRLVKPGSRVSVVIGKFRVDGLVVESPQAALTVEKP